MNIQDKEVILKELLKFLEDNNITKTNMEDNKDKVEQYLKDKHLGINQYIPGVYKVVLFDNNGDKQSIGRLIYYNGKNGGWGFKTNEFSIEKKEEGTIKELPNEIEVVEVNKEIPKQLDKVNKNDKDFEEFLTLYTPLINDKFKEEYGDMEDKDLWNDLAKEMFLKSKYYILKGDEVKPEKIEENKTIKKENSSKQKYKIILHCYDDEDSYDDEITQVFNSKEEAIKAMKVSAIDELHSLQETDDKEFAEQYSLGTKGDNVIIYKNGDKLTEYEVVTANPQIEGKKITEDLDRVQNILLKKANEELVDEYDYDEEIFNNMTDDEKVTEWFGHLYEDEIIDLCKEIGIDTYNGNLQLSDDRVLWDISYKLNDGIVLPDDIYGDDVTRALEDFESECKELDGEVYTDGRMQRHIVIKPTLQNILNYDTIKEQYMEAQKAFIEGEADYLNNFGKEEESVQVRPGADDINIEDDIFNTFNSAKSFESNFGKIYIIKDKYDKLYKIYKPNKLNINDYVYYTDSKEGINGFLDGAVKAINGVFNDIKTESNKLKTESYSSVRIGNKYKINNYDIEITDIYYNEILNNTYIDYVTTDGQKGSMKIQEFEELINKNIKQESKTKLQEDSYDKGIFYEIEQAFEEAGLQPSRFSDDGILTRNIGWTVTSPETGKHQQISCDGSWYDEDEDDEELDESKKLTESNTAFIDLSEALWYAEQYLNSKIGKCLLLQRPDGQITITLYDNEDKWLNLHNQLAGLTENKKLNEELKKDNIIKNFANYDKVKERVEKGGIISDSIINEFFTEVFYDMQTEEDLNEVNKAEEIVRKAVDVYNDELDEDYGKQMGGSEVADLITPKNIPEDVLTAYNIIIGNTEDLNECNKITELYDPIESKLPDLAREVQSFMYDFDTYDYNDNYENDEEAFDDAMQTLLHPISRNQVIERLNNIIKEDNLQDIKDKAQELINRINKFEKELDEYNKKEESRVEDGNVILTTPKEGLQNVKEFIDTKLGNIFKTQFVDAGDVVGLKLTRKQDKIDLIPVMDSIINTLDNNGYTKKDYEIELMGNDLILGMNNIAK